MPDLPCADQKIEVAAVRHRLRVVQQRQRRGRGGGTRKIVAPVDLPALAAVGRKPLIPVRPRAVDIVPAKADIDVAVLEPVAAVKNALIAVESSDRKSTRLNSSH